MLDSCFLRALEKHKESIFLKLSITAAVSRTNTLTLLFMYLYRLLKFSFFLFFLAQSVPCLMHSALTLPSK